MNDNLAPPRELNEAEVRAAFTLAMLVMAKQRTIIAGWATRGAKPPGIEDFLAVLGALHDVEQEIMTVAKGAPTDGEPLAESIIQVGDELTAMRDAAARTAEQRAEQAQRGAEQDERRPKR